MSSAGQSRRRKRNPFVVPSASRRKSEERLKSTTRLQATQTTTPETDFPTSSMKSSWSQASDSTRPRQTTQRTKSSQAKPKIKEYLTLPIARECCKVPLCQNLVLRLKLSRWRSTFDRKMSYHQNHKGNSMIYRTRRSNSIRCSSRKSARSWKSSRALEGRKNSSQNS